MISHGATSPRVDENMEECSMSFFQDNRSQGSGDAGVVDLQSFDGCITVSVSGFMKIEHDRCQRGAENGYVPVDMG